MASKLRRLNLLRAKAVVISRFTAKNGCDYYKHLMEKNKHYVQHPPTRTTCKLLSKQLFYTRLASIPSRYKSFRKELDYVKHLVRNRQELMIEDVGSAALFGLECFAWFCAGVIIGRGFTITGYRV